MTNAIHQNNFNPFLNINRTPMFVRLPAYQNLPNYQLRFSGDDQQLTVDKDKMLEALQAYNFCPKPKINFGSTKTNTIK